MLAGQIDRGQINRGQYLFAVGAGRLAGFGGRSFAPQAKAERWLAGQGDSAPEDVTGGDCMIVNAWQAMMRPRRALCWSRCVARAAMCG